MLPGYICALNVSFHWFQRPFPASPNVSSGNFRRRVGKECVLPIRHLCRNRLRTPCGFPGRQIRIERREAHMVA
jgi:hypothetical protein